MIIVNIMGCEFFIKQEIRPLKV